MSWQTVFSVVLLASTFAASETPVFAAESACAQECSEDQHCCERTTGTFCAGQACAYTYSEGQCVPREQNCQDFWCGSQHCQKSWFSSQNICCIYQGTDATPAYSCSPSILSCRGNSEKLTIRPRKSDSSS